MIGVHGVKVRACWRLSLVAFVSVCWASNGKKDSVAGNSGAQGFEMPASLKNLMLSMQNRGDTNTTRPRITPAQSPPPTDIGLPPLPKYVIPPAPGAPPVKRKTLMGF